MKKKTPMIVIAIRDKRKPKKVALLVMPSSKQLKLFKRMMALNEMDKGKYLEVIEGLHEC